MRKCSLILTMFLVMGFAYGASAYETETVEHGTKDDAVALVKKAVDYFKANGLEKAMAAFNDPKGQFVDHDLYIIAYDTTGTCLAHGANAKLVGKNRIDEVDIDGKQFIKERMDLMKTKQSFWQTYKWVDPLSHRLEPKEVYCEVAHDTNPGDIVMCAGVYYFKK